MVLAQNNKPFGPRFTQTMAAWLSQTGFNRINKATRSQLIAIVEHRAAIETWRDSLPLEKRRRLNHPDSVLRAWRKSLAPTAKSNKRDKDKVKVSFTPDEFRDLAAMLSKIVAAHEHDYDHDDLGHVEMIIDTSGDYVATITTHQDTEYAEDDVQLAQYQKNLTCDDEMTVTNLKMARGPATLLQVMPAETIQ